MSRESEHAPSKSSLAKIITLSGHN